MINSIRDAIEYLGGNWQSTTNDEALLLVTQKIEQLEIQITELKKDIRRALIL